MKTVKAYVCGKDTAIITCVQCGKTKEIDVSRMKDVYVERQVSCPCGASFKVLFEKRSLFRKEVRLPGTCWKTGSDKPHAISVKSLTRNSVGFQFITENLTHCDEDRCIRNGDSLMVEFALDNEPKTLIRGKVVVRSVSETGIGAEFINLDGHGQKQLGFYVLP